jgi:hypothetical protein
VYIPNKNLQREGIYVPARQELSASRCVPDRQELAASRCVPARQKLAAASTQLLARSEKVWLSSLVGLTMGLDGCDGMTRG